MNNSNMQRLIPIALVLIVIIVAIAALVSLGRSMFGGGDKEVEVVNTGQQSLLNTAIDRSVKLTVRGPLVADENYHSYTITASATTRTLTTYEGYLGRQVDTRELSNNTRAYEEFVHALNRLGMMEGKALEGEANDVRGICPTGRVYEFETLQASNSIKKLWTTTCRDASGSLDANEAQIMRLFKAQIPDNAEVLRKVKL